MMLLSPAWLWLLPLFSLYLYRLYRQAGAAVLRPKSLLLATAVLLGIVALSRPALPQKPVQIERQGSDIIFAVDISRSMQATDIAPSRLEAAKTLLGRVVSADDTNRFGVLAFTTNPLILSPLTRDDELLLHLFSGLDTSMVMTKGTQIDGVLGLAKKLSRSEHPIVILLTDGGDATAYDRVAAQARSDGLIVDVVMLATAAGGTLETDEGKLLRDEQGGIVVTARNDAIAVLAEATGGSAIDGPDVAALQKAIRAQAQEDIHDHFQVILYRELFYYPLGLALLLGLLGMTDMKSHWKARHG